MHSGMELVQKLAAYDKEPFRAGMTRVWAHS